MEINQSVFSGGVILHVTGDIDLNSSPKFRQRLATLIQQQQKVIPVNMAEVPYIDSSGIATFIEAYHLLKPFKGRLILIGLQEHVRDVFAMTRVDKIFETLKDESELLKRVE